MRHFWKSKMSAAAIFVQKRRVHILWMVRDISTKFAMLINDITFDHAERALLLPVKFNMAAVVIGNFSYKPYLRNGLKYKV